ncbi:MAG: mechanosensitive ion channel domain-containing protein [Planctomycetota bacterium]
MSPLAKTVLLWLTLAVAVSAQAQDTPTSTPAVQETGKPALTTDAVQQLLQQAEGAAGLPDEVKAKVLEQYRQALADLERAADWSGKAAEFKKLKRDAPALLEAIGAELAQPLPEAKPDVPPDASLQQLEQRLAEEEAKLKAARESATGLDAERVRRADRRAKLPEEIARARQQLAELDQPLTPPPDESPELTQARQTALQARRQALEVEIESGENEVSSYDARGELLTARRDKAAREVLQAEAHVKAWQAIVNEHRHLEAEAASKAAKRDQRAAALQHPGLKRLAEENAELADRRAELAEKIERITEDFDQNTHTHTQISDDFSSVRKKVERAGLTYAMGQLLRQKREHLPDIRKRQRTIASRQAEISRVQVDLIVLEDWRSDLADLERVLQSTLAGLDPPIAEADRPEIETATRDLLQARRGFLDGLIGDYDKYLGKIADLDIEERQLIAEVQQFTAYISERVLWIHSTNPPRLSELAACWEAGAWLVAGSNWLATGRALWRAAATSPGLFIVGLPLFAGLLLIRRRLRTAVKSSGAAAAPSSAQVFMPTLEALSLTVLLALLWPAALWFVGWRISVSLESPDFAKAVAEGFKSVAVVFLTLELLRHVLRPSGIAVSHFNWPAARVSLLRRYLVGLMAVGLPAVFIVSTIEWTGTDAWQNSLGRFAFVIGQLFLAFVAQRVFRPRGRFWKRAAVTADRYQRLRPLWYALGVGLPLLLAVLATLGYYYTALHLARLLLASTWLILALILADSLALRWLLVSRRKLAREQARQRLAAARAEAKEKGEPIPGEDDSQSQLDLSLISAQTRSLVRALAWIAGIVGLWFIWVDVLPALNILDSVELWSTKGTVAETTTDPEGAPITRLVERDIAVTLADLALALLTLLVASIATKNVPGLLEIGLLQYLPLQAGERYAITTTARYLIVGLAVVIAATAIGVGWSKVQWLVAAMTVGLGFGLQEIFANFVSGLIILFERPIRMGDIVTVGDVTGKVSRIRTRATTIIDWDWKELVIPNKEFVTGQVVNWSLSDQVLRLVVKVGIAYGSDTRKARETLLDVAHASQRVLPDPKPKAFFQAFGDSSLNFELRVWVKDIDDWILTRHDLHQAIDDAFREAGIEIAFPQRDLHIRSCRASLPVLDDAGGSLKTGHSDAQDHEDN